MSFTSALYPNEPIINDTEGLQHTHPGKDHKTGLRLPVFLPMDRHYKDKYEDNPLSVEEFPSELLIAESEFQARIKEAEEKKSRLSDLCTLEDLPCKDQDNTNYCWINAPVYTVECVRLQQGQKKVILSPASAGGPIKNFRNVGGWGDEGLRYLAEHGCCPVSKWPANAISSTYYTEENKKLAKKYRVTEWYELKPRNHHQMISLLLRGIAVAVGYNWWGHEVTAVEAVWLDGQAVIRIRNSWGMGWGTQGYGILQGSRMYADDAVAPRVAIAA